MVRCFSITDAAFVQKCIQVLAGANASDHCQFRDASGMRFKRGAGKSPEALRHKSVFFYQLASRAFGVQVNQHAAYVEDDSLGVGTQRIMQLGHVGTTPNRSSCSTPNEKKMSYCY